MGKKRGIRKGGAPLDDDFAVPAPTIISEGIFLSGSASLQDPVGLQNLSISHCINCAAGDLESLRFKGIDVLELPLRDAADGGAVAAMAEALGPAVEYIRVAREGGGAVLVHCLAGVSRSATVVVAYLMQAEGWGLEAAFSHVVGKRPRVLPNPGFMKCLVGWEEALWRQKGEEGEFTPSLDINSYAVMMLQRGCELRK
mmetsp:Transcript_4160/g.13165  ORF Transcript_4160/g.13165 Transcript_4160/m.13165 type:complete len:199 (-) Transcript_4160:464-1060(-)